MGGIINKAVYSLPNKVNHLFPKAYISGAVLMTLLNIWKAAIISNKRRSQFDFMEKSLFWIKTNGTDKMLNHIHAEKKPFIDPGAIKNKPQKEEISSVAKAHIYIDLFTPLRPLAITRFSFIVISV